MDAFAGLLSFSLPLYRGKPKVSANISLGNYPLDRESFVSVTPSFSGHYDFDSKNYGLSLGSTLNVFSKNSGAEYEVPLFYSLNKKTFSPSNGEDSNNLSLKKDKSDLDSPDAVTERVKLARDLAKKNGWYFPQNLTESEKVKINEIFHYGSGDDLQEYLSSLSNKNSPVIHKTGGKIINYLQLY